MREKTAYTGIDWFRVVAALLVVAIHSSPLLSVSDTADFVFTRAIARVAVPFFFMISGFALFSRRSEGNGGLRRFVFRTLSYYAVAILIYLPLNYYMGLFREKPLAQILLKDLVFDGTIYHLWYFPAAIIGACIVFLLYRAAGFRATLVVCVLLYVLGLLGDSYYGFAEQIPFLKAAYAQVFTAFDYTRNGIFFTPLFMLLGGALGGRKTRAEQTKLVAGNTDKSQDGNARVSAGLTRDLIGFLVFFALMIAEALILHRLGVQRHDSMYLMLAPCMYFLFSLLLHARGARKPKCRAFSIIVYIIHPWVIAAILPAARLTGLSNIFVDNSVLHYIAVCAGSAVLALIWIWVLGKLRNRFKG